VAQEQVEEDLPGGTQKSRVRPARASNATAIRAPSVPSLEDERRGIFSGYITTKERYATERIKSTINTQTEIKIRQLPSC